MGDDSTPTWIEPAPVTPLHGDEALKGVDVTVRDFWSWAFQRDTSACQSLCAHEDFREWR
jgi:hypothetical protein